MPEPSKDPFLSTMRIEIPPDLALETNGQKKGEGVARRTPSRKIIRLSTGGAEQQPFAGQDFQALLQNIYDAVLITDPRGQIRNVNARAVQFFGYDAPEFTDLNVVQLISGATEELFSTIWQTLQGDRFVLIEACCNRKDETIFPAEISVNRLRLSSTDYLSFFIRNITLRKEAEERLRTSDTAIRNSGSGIAITDAAGNLQYCNPAIMRLWGLGEQEVQGLGVRTFLADPRLADEMNRTVREGGSWAREMIMKRRDGITFFAQVSVAPNVNPDGELSGMVLSLQDISVLKRAQAELEDYAQKLRLRNNEMEDDLNMAREVQLAFLPQKYPSFPAGTSADQALFNFSHLYHPSGGVGGDFFDIIRISDTQAGVLISDVAGHGMRAALVVATIRGLIEQLSPCRGGPGRVLHPAQQGVPQHLRTHGRRDVHDGVVPRGGRRQRSRVVQQRRAHGPLPPGARRRRGAVDVPARNAGAGARPLSDGRVPEPRVPRAGRRHPPPVHGWPLGSDRPGGALLRCRPDAGLPRGECRPQARRPPEGDYGRRPAVFRERPLRRRPLHAGRRSLPPRSLASGEARFRDGFGPAFW
ncbi:MAG: PAS domain S-box protein [Verrucomicrobiota bacterium]